VGGRFLAVPRISDREIIGSLADLKAELKAGQKVIDQRFEQSSQQFNNMHNTMLTFFATVGREAAFLRGNDRREWQHDENRAVGNNLVVHYLVKLSPSHS
jgi:hypothetical protein